MRLAAAFGQPDPQDFVGGRGQWDGSVFAALAKTSDVGAGAEGDVCAVQPGYLGKAKAGLQGEQQQCVVAAAFPSGAVGSGEEGVDLGCGEECDELFVEPFGGDRQDALDECGVLGMT